MQTQNFSLYHRKSNTSSQLASARLWLQSNRSALSEACWGSCAFLLFLIAGPFSAPVVLLALMQLARKAQEEGVREPLCL